MINLLPPEGQRALKREYWLRVISVWSLLLAGLSTVFMLLLIPRFVLTHAQLQQFRGQNEESASIEERYLAVEKEIAEINMVVEYLMTPENRRSVSALLDAVYGVRTPRIEYTSIGLERKNGVVKKVQLQGNADTRADLIALRSALERSPLFTTVSIPLSDLARDADLPFVITIAVADEK